jgi:tetratricopeptide (TPR) repeat protein
MSSSVGDRHLWREPGWKLVFLLLWIAGPVSADRTRNELLHSANRLIEEGHFAEAEKSLRRALTESVNTDASVTAAILNNLGSVYQDLGEYAKAEQHARRSLSTWETIRPPGHLDLARPLNTLAGIYTKIGRYSDAEQLYRRSLAIRTEVLGPNHLDVGRVLSNQGELQLLRGRHAAAEQLFRQALAI